MENREIKFRAWDKLKKEMVFGYELSPYGVRSSFDNLNEDIESMQKDFVLMQYTGLKDKNGKEIFEGDIIKYIAEAPEGEKISGIARVEFTEELMAFRGYSEDNGDFDLRHPDWAGDSHLVIGNIYENPELNA